ncbi:something about silencing protein 10-like [Histomonas meleagridis]|uniref:something about silencing protein 10-like n=1 Tax=Histomonas meleagridis TaxID=135588 RepID=UPI003559E566|nr:something about silencing protein 10-like [Histomonas meleagridis]KAH0802610.1 something about silencing protein 10-like [Histomonas meleagridis]
MKSGRKKRTRRRRPNVTGDEVPVMQINTNWGRNKKLYFEDGDSGSESDEEHLVEEAIEKENQHLATLDQKNFKIFGNVKHFTKPLEVPSSITDLEAKLDAEQRRNLERTVRNVIRDITDASRELQFEFNDTVADQARKQLLYSLVTNGCFYLHMVASGFKSSHHPALRHIEQIKSLLGVDTPVEEEEVIEAIEEEEEEANEQPVEETKHIPVQLRTIKDGEFRAVTRNILKNQIIDPNKHNAKKPPRSRRRLQYAHAMHKYNKTHQKKNIARDGIYRGELSGFNANRKGSVKLHPAH